jgi:hypothetical protein
LQDKNGRTKIVYINDASGNRIGGYFVRYDANGRETGRESFTDKPATPDPAVGLDGTYDGRISGGSSGALKITVLAGRVSGTIGGVHEGDPITASFASALGADGSFSAPATGVLRTTWGDGKTSTFTFTGTIRGKVDGKSGAGTWSGGNNWGKSSGSWQAAK